MKKHKILTVVFGLAILIAGALAVKANAFGPPPPGGGCLDLRMLMELDLSDSQKAGIRNLISKYREKEKEIMDQLLEAKEKTMDVVESEPFDEKKVRQAFQQVAPLLEDAMVLRTQFMAELRQLLNPDQLEFLEEKKAEISGNMEKGMRFREEMIDTWLQMDTE